jgi:acyl-CoA reductase-like NAD-dependent aldehyde dehydrogenase
VVESEKTRSTIYHDPLGVTVSITPWNFPLGMPHNLMIPSLLAGNSVIFKPSEEVSLTGKLYADLLNEFLPENVLQTVFGAGEQGRQLVESDIQIVTFTGSQETGEKILETAGRGIKRAILEMGGKDPLIVLSDADITAAAKFAAINSTRNAGQVCVSTEKIYVDGSIYDEFLNTLKIQMETIDIGPMINRRQKDKVIDQVDDALSKGAKIFYGQVDRSNSNRVSPLVLTDLNSDMKIMNDETFGPIACVKKVNNEDEAVRLANDDRYALGGVVFGKEKAKEVARRLKSGMVGINQGVHGAPGTPWVGALKSGYGYHGSAEGHRQFTQIRVVSEPISV